MENNHKFGRLTLNRIAVLRALQLGDLLCTIPAFRALRAALPESKISLIGLPWARSFVDRFNNYIDDFIEFPGLPGFPERQPDIKRFPLFLNQTQRLHLDLAVQVQGSGGLSNTLVALLGARRSAGFYLPGQYCPDEGTFLSYPVHEPEIWRHLRLVEFLGFPLQGDYLEFPLNKQDWENFHQIEREYHLEPGSYACVHPGARANSRRWSPKRFAAVADGLARRGLRVVLTGTAEERYITASVAIQMNATVIDLTGKTDLGALGALLSGARLLVCNDTGISHMASALLTPSVVLFSDSDPDRWAPLNRGLHRVIPWASATIPSIVLSEVDMLLSEERVYAL